MLVEKKRANKREDEMGEEENFESKMTTVLKPVKPSAGYVDRLKHSLKTAPYAVIEREDNTPSLLMLLLGIATALATFFLLRRLRP